MQRIREILTGPEATSSSKIQFLRGKIWLYCSIYLIAIIRYNLIKRLIF
jgi:hypothetical protein